MPFRKLAMEFIGTFFLVFTIGTCVVAPSALGSFAALAIGSALMVMLYAGGHISGAHYNPAVTLAAVVRGAHPVALAVPYALAQVIAGVVAGVLVMYLKGNPTPAPMAINVPHALIVEFLFTFALAFVVLNVATAKTTANNGYFGLAIAFTVVAGALAVGGISGGAFNPAVAVSLAIMKVVKWADIWVHLAANIAGGIAAGLAFKAMVSDKSLA